MKLVLQRVSHATVEVKKQMVGEIARGMVVLLGVAQGDTSHHAKLLADKLQSLRVFCDDAG